MASFIDNDKRKWTVAVNVDAIRRVRNACDGLNLLDCLGSKPGEPSLVDRLKSDPVLLCDVLYVVCQTEAESAGVSPEQFGRAMAGDAIGHATRAMLGALADFFPSERRALLRKVLAKYGELEEAMLTAADKKLDDPAILEALDRIIKGESPTTMELQPPASKPGKTSGGSRGKLASTQAP